MLRAVLRVCLSEEEGIQVHMWDDNRRLVLEVPWLKDRGQRARGWLL